MMSSERAKTSWTWAICLLIYKYKEIFLELNYVHEALKSRFIFVRFYHKTGWFYATF